VGPELLLVTGAPSQSKSGESQSLEQPVPKAKQGKVASQSATTSGPKRTSTAYKYASSNTCVGPAFQPFRVDRTGSQGLQASGNAYATAFPAPIRSTLKTEPCSNLSHTQVQNIANVRFHVNIILVVHHIIMPLQQLSVLLVNFTGPC
jgi:hypothetical protein